MLNLDDARWTEMNGGYRVRYDPRPALKRLESESRVRETWDELWQELFHQGDVGEASFATVPQLVRIYRQRNAPDWNTYAIVSTIELARDRDDNPNLPPWLKDEYDSSITELALLGMEELLRVSDKEIARAILSVIAILKGMRNHARLLIDFSDEEVLDLETKDTP